MEECRVAWDEAKNAENKIKHKIGFEDAQFVFADPDRIERIDRSESNTSGETRWQTIGRVGSLFIIPETGKPMGDTGLEPVIPPQGLFSCFLDFTPLVISLPCNELAFSCFTPLAFHERCFTFFCRNNV
jgi:uncharacterized DUF497 family protein